MSKKLLSVAQSTMNATVNRSKLKCAPCRKDKKSCVMPEISTTARCARCVKLRRQCTILTTKVDEVIIEPSDYSSRASFRAPSEMISDLDCLLYLQSGLEAVLDEQDDVSNTQSWRLSSLGITEARSQLDAALADLFHEFQDSLEELLPHKGIEAAAIKTLFAFPEQYSNAYLEKEYMEQSSRDQALGVTLAVDRTAGLLLRWIKGSTIVMQQSSQNPTLQLPNAVDFLRAHEILKDVIHRYRLYASETYVLEFFLRVDPPVLRAARVASQHPEVITEILAHPEYKGMADIKSIYDVSIDHMAAMVGFSMVGIHDCRTLTPIGAPIKDLSGQLPLHYAIQHHQNNVVRELITEFSQSGVIEPAIVSVDATKSKYRHHGLECWTQPTNEPLILKLTPLMYAIWHKNDVAVYALLESPILAHASYRQSMCLWSCFPTKGFEAQEFFNSGLSLSPLHIAVITGQINLLPRLIRSRTVEVGSRDVWHLFRFAMHFREQEVIETFKYFDIGREMAIEQISIIIKSSVEGFLESYFLALSSLEARCREFGEIGVWWESLTDVFPTFLHLAVKSLEQLPEYVDSIFVRNSATGPERPSSNSQRINSWLSSKSDDSLASHMSLGGMPFVRQRRSNPKVSISTYPAIEEEPDGWEMHEWDISRADSPEVAAAKGNILFLLSKGAKFDANCCPACRAYVEEDSAQAGKAEETKTRSSRSIPIFGSTRRTKSIDSRGMFMMEESDMSVDDEMESRDGMDLL